MLVGSSLPPNDRPNRIPWPPLLDVATIATAYVLERSVPLDLLPRSPLLVGVGISLVVLGGVVGLMAIGQFRSLRTPVDPTGQATDLAIGGIYRVTRNPMYLGTLVLLAGLALVLGWGWLLLLLPVLATCLYLLAIRREEAFLERRFGDRYRDYKRKVRRWL